MEMRSVWNCHLLQVGSVPDCVGICVFFFFFFLRFLDTCFGFFVCCSYYMMPTCAERDCSYYMHCDD